MAIAIERVQKQHPEPGCRHFTITFIDEDTSERKTINIHERAVRRRATDTLDTNELITSLAYYVGQKGLSLEDLDGKVLRPDIPASRPISGRIATMLGGG